MPNKFIAIRGAYESSLKCDAIFLASLWIFDMCDKSPTVLPRSTHARLGSVDGTINGTRHDKSMSKYWFHEWISKHSDLWMVRDIWNSLPCFVCNALWSVTLSEAEDLMNAMADLKQTQWACRKARVSIIAGLVKSLPPFPFSPNQSAL